MGGRILLKQSFRSCGPSSPSRRPPLPSSNARREGGGEGEEREREIQSFLRWKPNSPSCGAGAGQLWIGRSLSPREVGVSCKLSEHFSGTVLILSPPSQPAGGCERSNGLRARQPVDRRSVAGDRTQK